MYYGFIPANCVYRGGDIEDVEFHNLMEDVFNEKSLCACFLDLKIILWKILIKKVFT